MQMRKERNFQVVQLRSTVLADRAKGKARVDLFSNDSPPPSSFKMFSLVCSLLSSVVHKKNTPHIIRMRWVVGEIENCLIKKDGVVATKR